MHKDISWAEVLGPEKQQAYFRDTLAYIDAERARGKAIYPPKNDTFNALRYTPLSAVKVVILGQDPYHGPGQAHGLCFSVPKGDATAIIAEHVSGAGQYSPRLQLSKPWQSLQLGQSGRVAAQYCAQCRTWSGTFPRPSRLGAVYRQSDRGHR